jgi:DNA-binding MurR/RpiR family transcriptional regulator
MTVTDAARAAATAGLSPAERRVVEAILADPPGIAFGTVAALATRSGTSGPTVVRVARRLGFDGYRALQVAVQDELTGGLAPAAERIRQAPADQADPIGQALVTELANVETTLRAVEPAAFATAVRLLADRRRRVLVIAGDAERGIAATVVDQLGQLRDGVEAVDGTPPRVSARVALAAPGDVALVIDVRRYDAWVLDAVADLRDAGGPVVAITDGPLSPLAVGAAAAFSVVAQGAGPFDSHVGTLALVHALVAGAADRLRASATTRLDRIEGAWRARSALHD